MANYLYNGVELPDINEVWTDKSAYPYAAILRYDVAEFEVSGYFFLAIMSASAGYADNTDNNRLEFAPKPNIKEYYSADSQAVADCLQSRFGFTIPAQEWGSEIVVEGSSLASAYSGSIVWSSYDILNSTDSSVYLAASDPVPVSQYPTTFDLKSFLIGIVDELGGKL